MESGTTMSLHVLVTARQIINWEVEKFSYYVCLYGFVTVNAPLQGGVQNNSYSVTHMHWAAQKLIGYARG